QGRCFSSTVWTSGCGPSSHVNSASGSWNTSWKRFTLKRNERDLDRLNAPIRHSSLCHAIDPTGSKGTARYSSGTTPDGPAARGSGSDPLPGASQASHGDIKSLECRQLAPVAQL